MMGQLKVVATVGMALFGLAGMATPSSAGLICDSVHGTFNLPDEATVYVDGGTQTIASGTTFDLGGWVTVSFSDTQITVTNPTPGAFVTEPFNGIELAFLSGSAITSVTEDPASSPLFAPGSVLTFSADDIMLNLSGTCGSCQGGEQIILDVTTAAAPVPEPASLAALGFGIVGLAAVRRRKGA